ncbi:related to SCS2-required for inositol metabolism [Sporisorium reilianum f. sp. reilianum]|uniref:Related to SCS2-required for inositol metabolism n=1 Tax=Sporisorium reilianum f. sp. reilianum TaxID=72559 RepID=A0A2N8UA71_9BASI|nr:related to SCS2-required for inositol metabolism [Sporisorium reilianum f. sp. reilianum]
MSVELSPHVQLGFPRPLTQLVKRTLTVSNPNNQPVAFKVKTTAPKQYCVRPNSGRIEPGEKVEVQVLLQPMKEEPPSSAKCRDKFLVQSTIITPDFETASLQEIWPTIEKENKSAIHEQKIRCAYLPATTAPLAEEDEGNTSQLNGDERYTTVRGAPSKLNGDDSYASQTYNPIAAAQNASANTDGSTAQKAKEAIYAAGGAAAAGAGAAAIAARNTGSGAVNGASAANKDTSSLSTSELQAEVARLRKELDQAKRSPSSANVQTASADGVPVHIVAAIAFAVFAITYVMF